MVNMALLAPMPSAREKRATMVNSGVRRKLRDRVSKILKHP